MPADATRKIESQEFEHYSVEIAEKTDSHGAWTVEAIDDDGSIEQAIFAGPKARERAEAYVRSQYGG